MTVPRADAPPPPGEERDSARERWESIASSLRERFDEPLARATELTQRTLAWFPVRVWRHFLRSNGFLLAASISYQSLFAMFAVVYVAFAGVGMAIGASPDAIQRMIVLIDRYLPGLIGKTDEGALISSDAVAEIARNSSGVLVLTGAAAVLVAAWTAIGFVTFTRRAVRGIFRLPFDTRNYFLLKSRDLLASALFGLALILGAVLGSVAAGALDAVLTVLHIEHSTTLTQIFVKTLSVVVAFAVNSAALTALFRFLTGTSLPWRRIVPGALLGGGAIAVLQLGIGLLFSYTPSNPLLATFSVMIGFLLWFRLVGIVILVSAAWIAVAATDRSVPLHVPDAAEQALAEHEALLLAAHIRLREARAVAATAPWYRRRRARRDVDDALAELADAEAAAPPAAVARADAHHGLRASRSPA